MEQKIGLIMVTKTRWADMVDIKHKLSKVHILDLISTELDGEPTILFFVLSSKVDFNLTIGVLELQYNVKGIYDI